MIDLNAYRHIVKPQVKAWVDARPDCSIVSSIGVLSLYTGCNIIAITYYLEELYGASEALIAYRHQLQVFYDETVKGVEDGS